MPKHLSARIVLLLLSSLLLLGGCPKNGANQPAADEDAVATEPLPSPLAELSWDGQAHSLPLADFCEMLQTEGAAALLEQADFSGFSRSVEEEDGPAGRVPILVRRLAEAEGEEQTPVGFQAQLIAFGEGQRLIFGFSAAWYETNFGLTQEQLDEQFRALHEAHGGAMKNYAWSDPDYDISFWQFNFDNDASGTWGSPYMTRKHFTMHGDLPQWDFYCFGSDAGATLATRQNFMIEAAKDAAPAHTALPEGLDPQQELDGLLMVTEAGIPALLEFLEIPADSGSIDQDFELERLLKPRTLIRRYTVASPEGEEASLELLIADNSELLRLSFTEGWLAQRGLDRDSFNSRFDELQGKYKGWVKDHADVKEKGGPPLHDRGFVIGAWEVSRREISIAEGLNARSWSINPAPQED